MKTIYLIGAMSHLDGQTTRERFEVNAKTLERLGFSVLHPMQGQPQIHGEIPAEELAKAGTLADGSIVAQCRWKVAQADFVVLLSCDRPSLGSAMELAWAAEQPHTHIITVGLRKSPMDHPLTRGLKATHLSSWSDLLYYLGSFSG